MMAVPTRNRGNSTGILQQLVSIIASLLRIITWPIKLMHHAIFPGGEYDGLSPAVTEKAAQQFVNSLVKMQPEATESIRNAFSTMGFNALKREATRDHSLLIIYIQSPLHWQSESHLRDVMLASRMLEFLGQDRIKTLGSSIHTSQGASLAFQLRASYYPMLAILQPGARDGGLKLVFKAEGPLFTKLKASHLIPLLQGTYQRHLGSVAEHEARRIHREQETELRRQQDAEFQEALLADQQREIERREAREIEERQIKEAEEASRKEEQAEAQRLESAKASVPPEPEKGAPDSVRVRFNLPSGKKLDRRFMSEDTVGSLRAYLVMHFADENPHIKNIALSSNFPKRTYADDHLTLEEADLTPQALLMVQDLDA